VVEPPLEVRVTERDGDVVLELIGELDAHTAPDLSDAVTSVAGAGTVVDLSGVSFCDSSGLRALVAAVHAGARVDLEGAPLQVLRVVELTGTRPLFDGDLP
jgi:anti-sigma B factor antagonist